MPKILVTGSLTYDLFFTYEGSFQEGITRADLDCLSLCFVTQNHARAHGGTGANIAWNLRLLQQEPLLVGTVGHDGEPYCHMLREQGIQTTHVEMLQNHATSTAVISTDASERQITFFHPGADRDGSWPAARLDPTTISCAIAAPRDVRVTMEALTWCHQQSIPCVFDPGQNMLCFTTDDLRRGLGLAAGLVVNASEWETLVSLLSTSLKDVLSVVPWVIVTHGADGCRVHTRDESLRLPACPVVTVVDPTGAGDAFRAGLLVGMARGWALSDGCKLGAVLAAKVVGQQGCLLSACDLDEVFQTVRHVYGGALCLPPLSLV